MKYCLRLLSAGALLGAAVVPGELLLAQATPAVTAPVASDAGRLTTAPGEDGKGVARKPFSDLSASLQGFRDSFVSRARAQIGTRYKMGGTAPDGGFDCSGLVRFVATAFDIVLPRTARQQATMGVPVPKNLDAMKPGDLLTFGRGSKISHIGIYVGDGRFVHASTARHQVIETSLVGTHSPLIKQWKGVRRVAEGSGRKMRDSVLAMLDSIR